MTHATAQKFCRTRAASLFCLRVRMIYIPHLERGLWEPNGEGGSLIQMY